METILSAIYSSRLYDVDERSCRSDDCLLPSQVKEIPLRFDSVEEYWQCFRRPTVEELRSSLEQNLEEISTSPYAVVTIQAVSHYAGLRRELKKLVLAISGWDPRLLQKTRDAPSGQISHLPGEFLIRIVSSGN